MGNYRTTKETAMVWNISERRVVLLCKEGRIAGAIKEGRVWKIPVEAEKPLDKRVKTGKYKKIVR